MFVAMATGERESEWESIFTEQETYNIESTGLGVANLLEQRTDGLSPVLLPQTLMFDVLPHVPPFGPPSAPPRLTF